MGGAGLVLRPRVGRVQLERRQQPDERLEQVAEAVGHAARKSWPGGATRASGVGAAALVCWFVFYSGVHAHQSWQASVSLQDGAALSRLLTPRRCALLPRGGRLHGPSGPPLLSPSTASAPSQRRPCPTHAPLPRCPCKCISLQWTEHREGEPPKPHLADAIMMIHLFDVNRFYPKNPLS